MNRAAKKRRFRSLRCKRGGYLTDYEWAEVDAYLYRTPCRIPKRRCRGVTVAQRMARRGFRRTDGSWTFSRGTPDLGFGCAGIRECPRGCRAGRFYWTSIANPTQWATGYARSAVDAATRANAAARRLT